MAMSEWLKATISLTIPTQTASEHRRIEKIDRLLRKNEYCYFQPAGIPLAAAQTSPSSTYNYPLQHWTTSYYYVISPEQERMANTLQYSK